MSLCRHMPIGSEKSVSHHTVQPLVPRRFGPFRYPSHQLGSTACPPTDTVDTIEYRVTGDLIGNAFTPVDGVLFTANYTVLTPVENIPIKFQTGCTTTSVPGGVCVTIQAGTFASVPETVQTA